MRSHHPLPQIEICKSSYTPHSSSIYSLHPKFLHSKPFGKQPSSSSHSWTGRAHSWSLRALYIHSCNAYKRELFSLHNNLLLIETLHPHSIISRPDWLDLALLPSTPDIGRVRHFGTAQASIIVSTGCWGVWHWVHPPPILCRQWFGKHHGGGPWWRGGV